MYILCQSHWMFIMAALKMDICSIERTEGIKAITAKVAYRSRSQRLWR